MDVRSSLFLGAVLLSCTSGCFRDFLNKSDPITPPTPPAFTRVDEKPALPQNAPAPMSTPLPTSAQTTSLLGAAPAVGASQIREVTPKSGPEREFKTKTILTFARSKESEGNITKDPQERIKHFDAARGDFQTILSREPKHREALLGLARCYNKLRDFDRANDTYAKGLALYPKDADFWFEKGMMLKDRRMFAEAAQSMDEAHKLQPENRDVMRCLGYTLGLAGRMEECYKMLERSVGSAQAHFRVAQFYEMQNQHTLSRRHCLVAMQEQPNIPGAQELLVRLGQPVGPATTAGFQPVQ